MLIERNTLAAFGVALLCSTLATASALAKTEHRELSSHEHGHGSLNIAIEGKLMQIELEAPGNDVVGFETKPATPEQEKKVEDAKAKLADPVALFGIPKDAACKTKTSKADLELEDSHSEFHATYTLECANIGKLNALKTTYFTLFTSAEELEVQIISDKGQKKLEIDAKSPVILLGR